MLTQFIKDLQAAQAWHVQVKQDLLRGQAHGQIDAFATTGGLPHHRKVVTGIEQLGQAPAKQRVIIDQ
jgi:hypothetical protein